MKTPRGALPLNSYGFGYAIEHSEDKTYLRFPSPVVIYFGGAQNLPEESVMTLDFGEQGSYEYRVKNFLYFKHNVRDINQRKMVLLIPFQLLQLKDLVQKKASKENFLELQTILTHDILGSIKANLEVGNITEDDANQLIELSHNLYDHLYDHYFEIGGYEEMKTLLPGAWELPLDKYRLRIDELEKENEKTKQKLERERAENRKVKQEKTKAEQEIEALKQKIKELTTQ